MSTDSPVIIVVAGTQWGDEGKGKLVDALAKKTLCCARFNGGSNAGHTLMVSGKKLACHLLPCSVFHPEVKSLIGNGVVLHLPSLAAEIDGLEDVPNVETNLRISSRCHLTFNFHIAADTAYEISKTGTPEAIGTTRRGIGPSYAAKALRISLRACDLLLPFEEFKRKYMEQCNFFMNAYGLKDFDYTAELEQLETVLIPRFKDLVVDSIVFMDSVFSSLQLPQPSPSANLLPIKSHMVIEGANAVMLDLNVGSYPYCTSSDCLVSGVGGGLSLPPRLITSVVGITKAYCTRVGEGPFPTELFDDTGRYLQQKGREYGVSTGRLRRCGWLDIPMIKYTNSVSGFDSLMLTKLDVLSGLREIKVAVAYIDKDGKTLPERFFPANLNDLATYTCEYKTFQGWDECIEECQKFEDLPSGAQHYVVEVERLLGIPIRYIGVGPGREATIIRE